MIKLRAAFGFALECIDEVRVVESHLTERSDTLEFVGVKDVRVQKSANFEILTYFARVLFSSTTRKNAQEIAKLLNFTNIVNESESPINSF